MKKLPEPLLRSLRLLRSNDLKTQNYKNSKWKLVKSRWNPKSGLSDLENDLLTSMTSEGAKWFFSKITFLKSVHSKEKDEACLGFLVKSFTKSVHRGGVPVLSLEADFYSAHAVLLYVSCKWSWFFCRSTPPKSYRYQVLIINSKLMLQHMKWSSEAN